MDKNILPILVAAISLMLILRVIPGYLRRNWAKRPFVTGLGLGLAFGPLVVVSLARFYGIVTLQFIVFGTITFTFCIAAISYGIWRFGKAAISSHG